MRESTFLHFTINTFSRYTDAKCIKEAANAFFLTDLTIQSKGHNSKYLLEVISLVAGRRHS